MNRRIRQAVILAIIFATLVIVTLLTLPRVVDLLPGQLRARIPEAVVALITTPLPTALPAPEVRSADTFEAQELALLFNDPMSGSSVAATATGSGIVSAATPVQAEKPVSPVATPTLRPTNTPTPTATRLPSSVELGGLKIIAQKFNNCGPANLTMMLQYYGVNRDQLEVGSVLKPSYDDRNVSPTEIVDYVNETTHLGAAVLSGGELEILRRFLTEGFPIIIEKGLLTSQEQGWMGHYLTIIGYDDARRIFIGLDTYLGPWDGSGQEIYYESLLEHWEHFNFTYIVVYPKGKESLIEEITGYDLRDPVPMWMMAATKAQQATEEDPENAFAWFNLGTSLTHLGKLQKEDEFFALATSAYDRAREIGLPWRMLWYQFELYEAYLASNRISDVLTLTEAMLTNGGGRNVEETFLYQGHALLASDDPGAARAAYRRALNANPNYGAAVDALNYLDSVEADE